MIQNTASTMKSLEINNVSKKYKQVKAVQGISFSVSKNEMIGLLGLNGAGKSTTIEMIATLRKPDEGNIYYKGNDIVKHPDKIRSELGYVPQEIMLFEELTGRQNLEFWGRAYGINKQQLEQAIEETVAICELQEKLNVPVKNYSGGMKRRMNIGVAILHSPQILILDEATVGIDIISANKIRNLVQELNARVGTTIIFTSHNMVEVENVCRRFLLLHQGRIISDISKDEIQKEYSGLQEYFLKKIAETEKTTFQNPNKIRVLE